MVDYLVSLLLQILLLDLLLLSIMLFDLLLSILLLIKPLAQLSLYITVVVMIDETIPSTKSHPVIINTLNTICIIIIDSI